MSNQRRRAPMTGAGAVIFLMVAITVALTLAADSRDPGPLPGPPPVQATDWRNDDRELLARLADAEAGDQPYPARVAVAAVALNRVGTSTFPSTLSGVIFQPGAFHSVSNGSIFRHPSDLARQAAQDAMNGWDPSYGSLYFWDITERMGSPQFSRRVMTRIGRLVFAR